MSLPKAERVVFVVVRVPEYVIESVELAVSVYVLFERFRFDGDVMTRAPVPVFVMLPVTEFEIVVVAAEEIEIADVDVELVRIRVAVDVATPVWEMPPTVEVVMEMVPGADGTLADCL